MGGMEMFKAQDVAKVAFKPPPPPVQEVLPVQAQDIVMTPSKPAEDLVAVAPQGQPSEISVVTPGPTVIAPPPPATDDWFLKPDPVKEEPAKTEEPKKKKDLFDMIGDFLGDHGDDIVAIGGALLGGGEGPKIETPKEEPVPVKPADPPKVETPKPKDPPKVEPKEEDPPIPASGRTFKTQGDPIVKTGDGLQYSLNEPGKYVSLQSKSGDFRMEQEVQETKGGRHYNTAMGFKVGSDTIKFDTDGGKGPASLTINGKKVDIKFTAFSQDLPGGGKLSYDPKTNKINITSPEGDKITVHRAWNDQKTHYVNAEVELSAKRPAGSVFGVLGTLDADNDAKNDARMRDGSVFKGAIGDLWKTPEDFAKEWRTRAGEGIL